MQVAENHQAGRYGPRWWLWALAPPLLLLAITVGFYWHLVLADQSTCLNGTDVAYQVLPWFQFQAGEWHRGAFPLWDPHQGIGQPLLGQAQPGAAYPPNWILFSLPLNKGWIRQVHLHWYFVLTRFLAALFCYWLCRDLKRSRAASILAGVVFGLGGYIGVTEWPQMVNGAIWAPLVFLFMLRALRGRHTAGSAALAGMFLGVSWLSGHHQIPLFLTLVVAAIWGYHVIRRWRVNWMVLRSAGLFCLFATLTGALQVLPAIEYGRLARRWVNAPQPVGWNERIPYTVHLKYSLEPTGILGLVIPSADQHSEALVGWVALSLAIAGAALALRHPGVRLFALAGAAGILVALGGYNVLHGVLYAVVPMVEKARVPQAATVILHFSIAVLSAWGIDKLTASRRVRPSRLLGIWFAATAAVLYLLVIALWLFKDKARYDPLAYGALVCLLAAAVLFTFSYGRLSRAAAVAACLVLVLMELGYPRSFWLPQEPGPDFNNNIRQLSQFADIDSYLKLQPWPMRVTYDDQRIPFNFGDWYGIDTLTAYSASWPANFLNMGTHRTRVETLLGVGYHIGAAPRRPDQSLVFAGDSGLNVYQNAEVFPRVWVVHEVVRLERPEQVEAHLGNPGFPLATRAFVVGELSPALEPGRGRDTARLVWREPDYLRIEAELSSKGMVVVSEGFFPGWEVRLDGRLARIHEVYGGLRGVVAPAGRHVIEMRYRPLSFRAGLAMTLLGVLGACVLALGDPLRRRVLRYRKAFTQLL